MKSPFSTVLAVLLAVPPLLPAEAPKPTLANVAHGTHQAPSAR